MKRKRRGGIATVLERMRRYRGRRSARRSDRLTELDALTEYPYIYHVERTDGNRRSPAVLCFALYPSKPSSYLDITPSSHKL